MCDGSCSALDLVTKVPHEVAYEFQVFPVSFNPKTNTLGLIGVEPLDRRRLEELQRKVGCSVTYKVYKEWIFWLVFECVYPPRFERRHVL
jgi:hypothetical protein